MAYAYPGSRPTALLSLTSESVTVTPNGRMVIAPFPSRLRLPFRNSFHFTRFDPFYFTAVFPNKRNDFKQKKGLCCSRYRIARRQLQNRIVIASLDYCSYAQMLLLEAALVWYLLDDR